MGNRLQKMLYHLSAASPVCFVFAIVWLIQKRTWHLPTLCVLLGVIVILVFCKSFKYGLKNLAPIHIRTSDISPNDGWIVIYIFTYLFPFTSIVLDDFNLNICAIIAFLMAIVVPYVNSAIPNPILFFMRYHFYNVSAENGISGYVLISKRKYRNKQELKLVNRVFDFLLIDEERK